MGSFYTNADGLTQHYGTRGTDEQSVARKLSSGGMIQELVVDFDYSDVGSTIATFFKEDSGGGVTPDSPSGIHAYIPANATIIDCTLHVKTAFDSGGAETMDIGLYQADGTTIDADGIDAAIAETAIDADGDVIVCDGALAANVDVGANNAFIAVTDGGVTSGYTVGEARLVVRYTAQRA